MGRLFKVTAPSYSTWEDWLKGFLTVKAAEGLRDRTFADYRLHAEKFFTRYPWAWGDSSKLKEAVLQYFAETKKLAPATHNTRRK